MDCLHGIFQIMRAQRTASAQRRRGARYFVVDGEVAR